MRVLGIDHGKRSGWALIEDGEYLSSGVFILDGESQGAKSLDLFRKAKELIMEHNPDVIALEKPVDNLNAVTVRSLVGYYNTLLMVSESFGLKQIDVYPTQMKKDIVGSGKAEKIDVAKKLCELLNLDLHRVVVPVYYKRTTSKNVKNYMNPKDKRIRTYECDESDAIALAYYAYKKVVEDEIK